MAGLILLQIVERRHLKNREAEDLQQRSEYNLWSMILPMFDLILNLSEITRLLLVISSLLYNKMCALPIEEYFPFGQEGERLRLYVQEQLNGEETRKREEILKQFQKEAEVRRHNYMRFHRFSDGVEPSHLKRSRYHTLEPRSLEHHT